VRPELRLAAELADQFLDTLDERPASPSASYDELVTALERPLAEGGEEPEAVVAELARALEPGLVGTQTGRYYGFVIGSSLPAALAADWLASAWDQNAFSVALSPAAAATEAVAGRLLADLLGLPEDVSFGFVTGAQGANTTGLAAARTHVLAAAGWDVAADGFNRAPPVRVVVGTHRHVTIMRSLRLLGFGDRSVVSADADEQGRMRPDALREALAGWDGPAIVCSQAGSVNSGAVDPLGEIADVCEAHGAWLHVDGAFGLWAAASPQRRHLVTGHERADSWATDAHKWLNVPYDCGVVFCAHPEAHAAAMAVAAGYLQREDGRSGGDWVPESSRRARALPVYAALRQLGRSGVEELVERCCGHARRFAELLGAVDGVEILNDVVLNQVLVRFGDDDELTRDVVGRVQADGTCWLGGTDWHGLTAMRISVSSWRTTETDVERSTDAILAAWAAAGARPAPAA
jgi:glutamate/tyrosine decarboxylase-like PLP-dependent enzyme